MHSLIGIVFFFSVDFAQAIDANQGVIMLTKEGEWLWIVFKIKGFSLALNLHVFLSYVCLSSLIL